MLELWSTEGVQGLPGIENTIAVTVARLGATRFLVGLSENITHRLPEPPDSLILATFTTCMGMGSDKRGSVKQSHLHRSFGAQ